MAERIQLRRTKNPLAVGDVLICEGPGGFQFELTVTPEVAVAYFRQLMESRLSYWPGMHPDDRAYSDEWAARVADLRGRDLACWCPLDQPCHADVLIELAARVPGSEDR